jgi:hypothetical protein
MYGGALHRDVLRTSSPWQRVQAHRASLAPGRWHERLQRLSSSAAAAAAAAARERGSPHRGQVMPMAVSDGSLGKGGCLSTSSSNASSDSTGLLRDPPKVLVEAAHHLLALWKIFEFASDDSGSTSAGSSGGEGGGGGDFAGVEAPLQLRKVWRVRRSLGEGGGGSEIKALCTQLVLATYAFASHHGKRRSLRKIRVTREQFFAGASAWIMSTAGEEEEVEEGALRREASGGAARQQLGIPMLKMGGRASAGSDPGAAPGSSPAIAKPGAASEDGKTSLAHALAPDAARAVLLKEVRNRIDTGDLRAAHVVRAGPLAEVLLTTALVPVKPSPTELADWCKTTLLLPISEDMSRRGSLLAAEPPTARTGGQGQPASWAEFISTLSGGGPLQPSRTSSRVRTVLMRLGLASPPSHAPLAELDEAPSEHRWFIIMHTSLGWRLFDGAFVLLLVWDALTLPLFISQFEIAVHFDWMWPSYYVLDCMYVLRLVLRLFVTFVNSKSVVVTDPTEIRVRYLSHEFVVDLIACWPHDLLSIAVGASEFTALNLRLVKMLNLRYIVGHFRAYNAVKSDEPLLQGLVQYIGLILVASHYCAIVYLVLGFSMGARTPPVAWPMLVDANAERLDDGRAFFAWYEQSELMGVRYLSSMYFVLSLFTTLGSPFLPSNYWELAFYIFMLTLNMTLYAYSVGCVSAIVMKQDDEMVSKRGQLELVHVYISHMRVPVELKLQIESFFHARLKDTSISAVSDEQIYDSLPVSLQIEISTHTNRALVGELSLLRGCSETFVDRLSSLLRERTVEPETFLFRAGDVSKELFVIDAGLVELFYDADAEQNKQQEAGGTMLEDGDVVGDLPFVFRMRHFQSARTAGKADTALFTLTIERYNALAKMFPVQADLIMDNSVSDHEGTRGN